MEAPTLYFAYGSNLDTRDRRAWFSKEDLRDPLHTPLGLAYLPDFELVFHYHSTSRRGGALDVRPRLGQATQGMLFEVDEQDLSALDRKEGAPGSYRRHEVTVLGVDGGQARAITYLAAPDRISAEFIRPTPEYVAIVSRGMTEHGIDTGMFEAVAADRPAPWTIPALFVYGTLLRGEVRHGLLREASALECTLLAPAPGRLVDLGEYPALVPGHEPDLCVQGEFVRVADIGRTLEHLDGVEGFRGYDSDSLYERVLIDVDVCAGRFRPAWTYVMRRVPDGATPIDSGCWRASRGRRREFDRRLVAAHARGDLEGLARRIADVFPWAMDADRPRALQAVLAALERGEMPEFRMAQASESWAVLDV